MYGFWWHKPLDFEQATVIDAPATDNLLAYLYMISKRLLVPYRARYSDTPEVADIRYGSRSHSCERGTDRSEQPTTSDRSSALSTWR